MSKKRHKSINVTVIFILLYFLTFACSVTEQRSSCPCWVGLDFSTVLDKEALSDGKVRILELAIYDAGGNVAYSHSYGLDSCAPHYEIEMPRGLYTVSAVTGSIGIGPDSQADALYGKSLRLDAGDETAEAVIEPFKQYATLGIRVLDSPCDSLTVTLKAASAAIDRQSLEGLQLQYSCERPVSGGKVDFNMLRQAEGELQLSFRDAGSGRHITDIDLGRWLKETGYDFSADNLADIALILDFHSGTATLSIAGWLDAPTYFIIF